MESLFAPFKEKGLTSLKIQHDYKTGKLGMLAAREWNPDIDFSLYNKAFYAESILTDDAVFLNTNQVWEMYEAYNLKDHLEAVINLIKAGKHFGIEAYYYEKYDIRFVHCQHSKKMGVHNKRRGLFTGGTRRHELEEPEIDVIRDGLNLGRAMSFKNVPAGVKYGGAKSVLHMNPLDMYNLEQMGFIAFAIDKCKTMSTPDMKLPKNMVDVMLENFSVQWLAGPNSKLGSSAIPTAVGTFHAMKQALKFKTGNDKFDGISVAVQGLGEVGMKVAELLAEEKAKLFVADINMSLADEFKSRYPGNDITIVSTSEIMGVDAFILSPNAMGGIITEEIIPSLKFKIIIGAANNQLCATSVEEEIKLAKLLDERGILFQVDFWHNCGGVVVAIDEYELGENTTSEAVMEKVINRVTKLSWDKMNEAKERGITPTEAIYEECEKLVYGN